MGFCIKELIRKARKKNKGSLVLLVAVLAAFTGVIGTSLYEVTRSMHKNQVSRNKFTQYHLLTLSLRSIISRPDVCTLALKNQVFNPSESKSSVRVVSSVFEEKKFIGNIEDISNSKFILLNQGFTSDKFLAGSSAKLRTYKANLQVWLPHNTGGSESFNYEKLKIPIPLYVNIDEHNNINSCYGVYSKAALCERYWKSWDQSESDLDIQCNPDRQCILYSSTTCDPPSIKMSIGSFQSSSHSSTSALATYAGVGSSLDGMNKQRFLGTEMLKLLDMSLKEMEELKEQTKEAMDSIEADLTEAEQTLQQAQAALAACQAKCCSCGYKQPGCCGCNCSGPAAAVAAAQTSVNQLQAELNTISEAYNNMEQALTEMETMKEIAEVIVDAMRLGLIYGFHGLSTLSEKLSDSSQYPTDAKTRGAISDLLAKKEGIEKEHFGGKDMFGVSTGSIMPGENTLLDVIHNPDLRDYNRMVSSRVEKDLARFKDRLSVGDPDDWIAPPPSVSGEQGPDGKVTGALNFMVDLSKRDSDIFGFYSPLGEPAEGPNSISDWRKGVSSFRSTTGTFKSRNQAFYHSFGRYSSHASIVQQFTNPGTVTTVIQTNMKYMCLWCNEKRKAELKNRPTDSVLSKN